MTEANPVRRLIFAVLDELTLEQFVRLKAKRKAARLSREDDKIDKMDSGVVEV